MGSIYILNKEKVKNIWRKVQFANIKSDYFLQLLFNNLEKKKLLEIIKYNNNLKKRINININDYIEYHELIEIEIKPVNNKYGKFISIPKKYESYYHIYFNDNKEEIKRKKLNKNENIYKIKVILDYKIKSLSHLFYKCNCIKKITFIKFNTKDIVDMSYMFYECSPLEILDISNFNTEKVTDMSYMFCYCSMLKELKILNFKTNYL